MWMARIFSVFEAAFLSFEYDDVAKSAALVTGSALHLSPAPGVLDVYFFEQVD